MKTKNILLICALVLVLGIAAVITVKIINGSKEEKSISETYGSLSSITELQVGEDYGNTGGEVGDEIYRLFQYDETGAELDKCFGAYAENILFLEYSRMCLEEYLAHWLNNDVITVTDQDSRLYGTYVDGSYKEDVNFPSWEVSVIYNGEEHKIKCYYNISMEAFTYKSDLESK